MRHFCFIAIAAIIASAGSARALDKIYDPYVNKDEEEIEYSGIDSFDNNRDKNNIQSHEIELGYGLTDYWQMELSGGFTRTPGQPVQMEDEEIENKFQLTQPGEYWLDVGLLVSYAHSNHRGDADELETKLLLQKDIGKFSSLANIGLAQGLGHNNFGGPDITLEWNNRYRLNEYFQPGIEIQSDFGQTNVHDSFDNQEHFIGPSAYGKIFGGKEYGDIGYEAAYLFGVSRAAPAGAARVLLEYEMHF